MSRSVARVGHIDRSRSPVTPTDKMDCRHFHALSGRKRAAFLVSCLPMLFEGRRIEDPHIELRCWLDSDGMQKRQKRNEFRSTTKIVAHSLSYTKTPSPASEL